MGTRMTRAEVAAARSRRLGEIADTLARIPNDTPDIPSAVVQVVRDLKVTYEEFRTLDERDNYPGVPAWHWKLRATRNAAIRPSLFDVMAGRA